jgi:RNA polymerase sigma-70 factor (ECF subfamily)
VKPAPDLDPSKASVQTPTAAARPLAGDEADWIVRARAGDERAFARLVDRHRDRAYALALRIVRVPAEAEEVAQDAFVRVWRALPGFRGDAAFSTWLYRIVVRRSLDRVAVLRTRGGRESPLESVPEQASGAPGPADLETRRRAARLERLMGRLSEVQRIVVTLFYHQDRSLAEVARTLGLAENTVKTHLQRARAVLRSAWESEEES